MHEQMCSCTYSYGRAYTFACIHVCTRTCTYICMHTHTHTFRCLYMYSLSQFFCVRFALSSLARPPERASLCKGQTARKLSDAAALCAQSAACSDDRVLSQEFYRAMGRTASSYIGELNGLLLGHARLKISGQILREQWYAAASPRSTTPRAMSAAFTDRGAWTLEKARWPLRGDFFSPERQPERRTACEAVRFRGHFAKGVTC